MTPETELRSLRARLEVLEAEHRRVLERSRRRSAFAALAGKICPAVAVLGLATWVLAQGLEVKTTDSATDIQRMKIETSSGVGVAANAYFMNANLGIGTTAPANNLHVFSTTDPAKVLVDGVGVVGPNVVGRRANGTPGVKTAVAANDLLLFLGGDGYHSGGAYSTVGRGYIGMYGSEAWTGTAQGTYVKFGTTNTGTTTTSEKMRIAPAGDVRLTGNGQFQLGNLAAAPATVGKGSLYYNTTDDKIYFDKNGAWTELLGEGINSDDYVWNQVAADQAAGFRITGNGRIGGSVTIGSTAAPAAKLDIPDSAAAGTQLARIGDDSFLTDIDVANTLGVYGIQDNTIASVKLGSGGGTISGSGGNIGIGTTTPGYSLAVVGDARVTTTLYFGTVGAQLVGGNQGGSVELGPTNSAGGEVPFVDFHFGAGAAQDYNARIINSANNRLDVGTNSGGTVLTVNGSNVGIGDTTPTTGKLTVASSANNVDGIQINMTGVDTGPGADGMNINCTSVGDANGLQVNNTNAANTFATIYCENTGGGIAFGAGVGDVTVGFYRTSANGDNFTWYVGDGAANAARYMASDAYYTTGAAGGGNDQRRLRWNWNGTIVANITGTGNEYCDGLFVDTENAVDFAECVHTSDPTLEAAEVVLVDPGHTDRIVRSARPYDPTVMGVVSERPGVLLGAGCAAPIDMTTGWDVEADKAVAEPALTRSATLQMLAAGGMGERELALRERFRARNGEVDDLRFAIFANRTACRETGKACLIRPVAMIGRVPVKVTAEGGPIRIGDLITTSSTPGHAMKAAEPWRGGILGTALEAFEPSGPNSIGRILVHVHPDPAPSDVKAIEGLTQMNEDLRGRVAALEAEVGAVREARAALDADRAEMRDLLRQARGRDKGLQPPDSRVRSPEPGAGLKDPGPVSRAD